MRKIFNINTIENILFIILWFVLFNIGQIIGIIIQFIVSLISNPNVLNNLSNFGGNINELLKLMPNIVLYSEISSFIFISIIFVIVFRNQLRKIIKPIHISQIFISIGVALISYILITIVFALLPTWIGETSNESISIALSGSSTLLMWISVGLLAPLTEELVFRGGMIHSLNKINPTIAMIITSIVFGVTHGNLAQGLYATFLGLVFCFMNKKYNSILPGMIMHITINSISVLLTMFV